MGKKKAGAPDWMVTFSDLMTLLLTFFVLLLSMADTSTKKIETGVKSIREAFSGKLTADDKVIVGEALPEFSAVQSPVLVTEPKKKQKTDSDEENEKRMKVMDDELKVALENEIKNHKIEYKAQKERIIIEYPEESSFRSGSADLSPTMKRATHKLAFILQNKDVKIVVAGYTDNIPINNGRFRSNWDLSASRAASIAHELTMYVDFPPERIEVIGHGEGFPKMPNDTPENRAENRRVEVMIEPADPYFNPENIEYADTSGTFKVGENPNFKK